MLAANTVPRTSAAAKKGSADCSALPAVVFGIGLLLADDHGIGDLGIAAADRDLEVGLA